MTSSLRYIPGRPGWMTWLQAKPSSAIYFTMNKCDRRVGYESEARISAAGFVLPLLDSLSQLPRCKVVLLKKGLLLKLGRVEEAVPAGTELQFLPSRRAQWSKTARRVAGHGSRSSASIENTTSENPVGILSRGCPGVL
ncbi:uncharacterized protein VTP21DRAFT_5719 [Calcarisporiella thermophila]|uniref:uncharacterized protein n=1 Tax=Calcarisporiella thermophila TaxID=911321 RepID=UPI0037439500